MQTDLPVFYDLQRKYTFFGELPSEIVTHLVSEWQDPKIGPLMVGDWTNNWVEFECIWDWIMPLSRWGPLDVCYTGSATVVVVRDRIQTFGDIIPVMYRLDNHYEAIFRAGQRMFYCRAPRNESDEEDFEMDDVCILGVLPLTYDRFVDDPMSILPLSSESHVQSNLRRWIRPNALAARTNLADFAHDVIHYIKEVLHGTFDISAMEEWPDTEWDAQYRIVLK